MRCAEWREALRPYTAGVDTDEVLQRLQAALLPWHRAAPATIHGIHRRPDLTGLLACALTAGAYTRSLFSST